MRWDVGARSMSRCVSYNGKRKENENGQFCFCFSQLQISKGKGKGRCGFNYIAIFAQMRSSIVKQVFCLPLGKVLVGNANKVTVSEDREGTWHTDDATGGGLDGSAKQLTVDI